MENDTFSAATSRTSEVSVTDPLPRQSAAYSDVRQRKSHSNSSGMSASSTTSNGGGSSRRRRSSHLQSNKKKKKKRRWRWIVRKPRDLTPQQEQVFMTMKLRKLNRALTGTKTKRTRFEFLALVVYFVLALGVVSYSSSELSNTTDENSSGRIIVLDMNDIITMMVYILVVSIVTSVFRESKFITLLYWMFIYLPLAAMVLSFVFDSYGDISGFVGTNSVIGILLVISEALVFVGFLSLYKLYPKVVMSAWFRRKSRAGTFWRIKVISDWTMTYVGSWGQRFTCKYEGETNQQGLPHGFGRWIDDAYAGEVLTGTWINGIPVAPLSSRQFGTGDAFKAVRVGYIMASDDEFTTTKFWPTNDKPPRIGMCSVECSISGSFYNELPLATHLSGPNWLDHEGHTVQHLIESLTHVDDEEERERQMIQIKSNDPRGIQIRGHIYEPTGEMFHPDIDQVTVYVDKHDDEEEEEEQNLNSSRSHLTPMRSLNFMPRASRQSFRPERIIVCDESESGSADDSTDKPVELSTVMEDASEKHDEVAPAPAPAPFPVHLPAPGARMRSLLPFGQTAPEPEKEYDVEMAAISEHTAEPIYRMADASLRVQDWIPSPHKDALIFFPGYKVPLKNALEALGQFIAMTRLDTRVYPIIFGWPCGQRFTYHSASRKAATIKNRENLYRLVTGLQDAGVRNIHFMTHSMGVQTLLGAFGDNPDGSRSDLSQLFQLDPDFMDEEDVSMRYDGQGNIINGDKKLMMCRTITLLNPDFALEAFVDRAFRSIRRVCSTVTIIGDRHDKALYLSQYMNGIGVAFGYEQPEVLQPKPSSELGRLSEREVYQGKSRLKQQVIGLSIESLYFSPEFIQSDEMNDALLFKERAPVLVVTEDEPVQDRAWLDVDVIDTTGLDTNIAGIRHSGFNLNPILLKDLEELISTGRRAISRATLLYRDGNNFSYCHAPSFVAM